MIVCTVNVSAILKHDSVCLTLSGIGDIYNIVLMNSSIFEYL